jgi:1-acyl-sn-glycerol-3-phosphate acyltransferase
MKILGLLRFLLFIIFTLMAFVYIYIARLLGQKLDFALRVRRRYANVSLWFLGVKVQQYTAAPQQPCIIVSNHRSYLDVIFVLKDVLALPIGKAEVADWFVLGRAAKLSGVIFVQRNNKDSRAQSRALAAQALDQNHSITLCPEGTTTNERQTTQFRKGIFEVAAEGGFTIVPLAIEYKTLTDAWVGKDTFVPHFIKTFDKPRTHIKMAYGAPIAPQPDAMQMLAQAQGFIDAKLTVFQAEFASG